MNVKKEFGIMIAINKLTKMIFVKNNIIRIRNIPYPYYKRNHIYNKKDKNVSCDHQKQNIPFQCITIINLKTLSFNCKNHAVKEEEKKTKTKHLIKSNNKQI